MKSINKSYIYHLIIYFFLECLLGTIYEEILCIFLIGHIESRRGLLLGPFNLVYGIGMVLIIIFLSKIKKKRNVFILGTLLGGTFEYLIWLLQKNILKHESWNYSSPVKINNNVIFKNLFWGGTSFFHALFWGLISYIFIIYIYKRINTIINKIYSDTIIHYCNIFIIFIIVDALLTLFIIIRYNNRTNDYSNIFDILFNDNYIKLIFPNMYPV